MQSKSVLQLYYADHAFTDSLRTICQNAISSIHDDENDTNYNHLFSDLEEYWKSDHNIEVMLTVPSSIGSDKAMNNISLFLNYLPLVYMNSTAQPKTTGAKISFCDRLTADWAKPSVRIAFRTAIDIIYATFAQLVLKNSELSVEEVEIVISQMQNYLNIDNEYPDSGKFKIISTRYFAKAMGVLSKAQPEFIFNTFFSSLKEIVKSIKKQSSQEIDQKYLLNITLCLYSNLKTNNSQFAIDTKKFDKLFSSLFSILAKKSYCDITLQKDACICLLNFFGVILTDRPPLRDSGFLNNMVKLTYAHSKIFSNFYMLLTLLYCFDKSKHMSSEKKKFINKILSMKNNNIQGDALNVFTFFLRGELYVSRSEIDECNSSLSSKEYSWVPDQCVNQDILIKMYQYIFTDPKAFTSYQTELSDFLIQYASINYTTFINNFLEKILDLNFFRPNSMAVMSVGKVLLISGKKSSVSKDTTIINKMNRMLTNAVSEIMKNTTVNEGKSCVALHILPFWPIFTSHEMNYDESINHITQCCNPLPFRIHTESLTKIIKSKWSLCCSSFIKTNIFDMTESNLQIFNNVSTTNSLLINVMTIIPHFPNDKSLLKNVISLTFSPLTDISALAIRLLQVNLIKNEDCSIFEFVINGTFALNTCSNEILYIMIYTIDQLLDLAINLRLTLEDNIIDDINFAVIVCLCCQNAGVHAMALSVLTHLHNLQPLNSFESLLEKYDAFISYHSKRSALLTVTENNNSVHDTPDILFKSIANSNYSSLYLFYIASLGRCFSLDCEEMNTRTLLTMILNLKLSDKKWDPFIYTSLVTFLINAYNINIAYDDDGQFFNNYKSQVCDVLLKDARLNEWNGFHILSAVDCAIDPSMIKNNVLNQNQDQSMKKYHEENIRYRYNSIMMNDDDVNSFTFNNSPLNNDNSILNEQGNREDEDDYHIEWFSIKPTSNVIIQAISLGIRTSVTDTIEIETATNYITYLSSIVKYFKKAKLVHSKLTFSFSQSVYAKFELVVRVVLDAAAALFSVFYEKFKKVPAGPYMRKEIMGKNVSVYFDVEQWFCFILNFIPHKPKKSIMILSKKGTDSSNSIRTSAMNALSSLLSISPPPKNIYSKFIKNLSKYDDRSLSLILSYYTEKLLPTFVKKALSSDNANFTRYFNAIVNQFTDILPKDFIPKLMSISEDSKTLSLEDVSFADTFFAHTGTIIALAFIHITTDNKEARMHAFSLLFNVAVGTASYLNKPESVVRITDQMQSLMFTITSQLTNLYMSALQSISQLLSQELNIVSEQLISIILDNMAKGRNSTLLAPILAPWIKGPKFDDDTPIVFTATQPQFACFTRFSFAKSFSRIKLTTPLFFVIDSLLTTPGAASFLTIALFTIYQSDPLTYYNVPSTISYILQQRPTECVPLITSLFMFSTWFYYNIQLKSIFNQQSNKDDEEVNKQNVTKNEKKKNKKSSRALSKQMRGSSVLSNLSNLIAPDNPEKGPLTTSSSDPNIKKTYDNSLNNSRINDSLYESAIQFAVTTINSTNLEIYNGYEHRLLAHALITLDSTDDQGSSSLVPFLIPKLPTLLRKISNELSDSSNRERNKSNADINLSQSELPNLNQINDNNPTVMDGSNLRKIANIDFESLVMKEIRNKGTEFAQKLGMECLTWGLCCGNLNYAIRALFLYRKILMPANLQIITKLIECLKLASDAHKENKNDHDKAALLKSYVANCLETIRVIAEKTEIRTIDLWELCIDFISVNDPEIQTVSFNFLTFLVSDMEFVRNHIRTVSSKTPKLKNPSEFTTNNDENNNNNERRNSSTFKITANVLDNFNNPLKTYTNIITKINCHFDKESFLAFFNFVLCTSYEDLFEIVGTPEFVSVFILLLLPIVNSYNQQNNSNENPTTNNNNNTNNSAANASSAQVTNNNNNSSGETLTNSISLTSSSKRRRKSIVAMDDQMRRNSLIDKTDKISKLVSNRYSSTNIESVESNTTSNNNTQGRTGTIESSIDVDLSFFSLFEAKIDDFIAANKLSDLSQMTADEIKEEDTLDIALYIAQTLLNKEELTALCKILSCALSFSSCNSKNNLNSNLSSSSKTNLNSNSNSNININTSQSEVVVVDENNNNQQQQQQQIGNDNSFVYKFALEMIKSEKCDPEIFIPIVKASDDNLCDLQLKEDLSNEIKKRTGINLDSIPLANLYLASSSDINFDSTSNQSEVDIDESKKDTNSTVLFVCNLPFYSNYHINNNFSSSNDFSTIVVLPPLYILDINVCHSNLTVLEGIQRIRAQPLNDWTDLMFKAETTTTQVEVLKSRKMKKMTYFNDTLFLKQLKSVLSKSKSKNKVQERRISYPSLPLQTFDDDVFDDLNNFDLDVMFNESFSLNVDDVDQIWKETIKECGNNYDSLSSIKL